ncbi:MAG TPA: response regulator [Elusimicrobiota bacterium]|nr:response regulator [Elusimicrobiota bacterium]
MSSEKILICDDEPGMRLVLTNVLKPEGYNIFTAEDGATAIESVKREKPQLMLLDVRLPDMDGLEILANVKKISPAMPVIMLSGFGDVESAVGAMKSGAFDYLSKPFRVDDVRKLVQKALGAQTLSKDGLMTAEKPAASSASTAEKLLSNAQKKPAGSKSVGLAVGAVALLALLGGGYFLFQKKGGLTVQDKEFSVPYRNPTALCFDGGESLWVSDWVSSSLYKHKVDDAMSVSQIFQLPGGHPTGIAWDGSSLWTCNSWERKIYKHTLDASLSVAAEYPSPGPEPSGLYWDGVNLWVCDFKEAKFYRLKVSEEGLSVINAYDSPGPHPIGLFSTAENVWSADSETDMIYRHAKDNTLTVQNIYVAAPYEDKKLHLSGLGWDGKSLWTCADENDRIYRHALKNLKEKKF